MKRHLMIEIDSGDTTCDSCKRYSRATNQCRTFDRTYYDLHPDEPRVVMERSPECLAAEVPAVPPRNEIDSLHEVLEATT